MRKSLKHNRLLTAAVMAALLSMSAHGYAMNTEYVDFNGRRIAEVNFLSEGEDLGDVDDARAGYNLHSTLKEAVKTGTEYWTDMIGTKAKNGQPWQIYVAGKPNVQNANAVTRSLNVENGKTTLAPDNFVAKQLQDGKQLPRMTQEIIRAERIPNGDYGVSVVEIGQYLGGNREGATDGWWVDPDTVLPSNEQAADFVATIRHELGHALGIFVANDYLDVEGNVVPFFDLDYYPETVEPMIRFHGDLSDAKSWNLHLADQNLNPAKPGMEIVSGTVFAEKKKKNPGLKESDFFIVNNKANGENIGGKNGKAFFVGKNVTETLAGAKFFGVSGIPVNTWERENFDGSHLQTAGMMSHRDYSNYTSFMEVELAVMQDMGYDIDREAYFGHSVYGDGGTITNTQGYFARNAAGTAYVNGKPSEVPIGIGLHIYGSGNTVTQAADILTVGKGAAGVRVDGMKNTVTVPASTNIHADGLRGNGILIAYGRDQVVNQAGKVTADGENGTGIRFDFGSSSNGASDEYRGSYIRYKRTPEKGTGKIRRPANLKLTDMGENEYNASEDELAGPLVNEYNLTGTLSGAENAVYIGRNAFVKNINIKERASISGNITSDWKHFKTDGSYDGEIVTETECSVSFADWMAKKHPGVNPYPDPDKGATEAEVLLVLECIKEYQNDPEIQAGMKTVTVYRNPLRIQYNGKTGEDGYAYDAYIPGLVTNLNFNADMSYNGAITGPDNMKLNVKNGTLTYTGSADVVGVTVAEGATLLGGSYTVHDMSEKAAADFVSKLDNTDKGNFINHGTIGAADKDSSMKITGDLISDGTLQAVAGGSAGDIVVSGEAAIDGSDVRIVDAMPGDRVTVLTAGTVYGDTRTPVGESYELSGMMNAKNEINGGVLSVTTEAANNLNTDDPVLNETLNAMAAMDKSLKDSGDPRRSEMNNLFRMDAGSAKEALRSVSSNMSAKSMALVQRGTLTRHILSSRLTEAFIPKQVKVTIPVQHLDESKDEGVPVTLKKAEPAENDIWLKFGKNWGDLRGDTDYHSSITLLGWDKAYGNNWRAGAFAGYEKTSFADDMAGNELKDVRFGLYGGYSRGREEGMVFLNYGWMRNKLHRGVMGKTAVADYHSRILELGGEYLYDLQAGKNVPWHVRPYVNAQLSRLWQNGYSETGAGVFNQVVDSKHNDYFGAGAGVEFKRCLAGGNYAVRAGVKHAFAGAEPKLRYSYLGDQVNSYNMRNVQDRTHFVLSIGGDVELGKGWSVGGDAAFQRGSHDKDWSCSVTVRRMW